MESQNYDFTTTIRCYRIKDEYLLVNRAPTEIIVTLIINQASTYATLNYDLITITIWVHNGVS
jgi:hypothetical protein